MHLPLDRVWSAGPVENLGGQRVTVGLVHPLRQMFDRFLHHLPTPSPYDARFVDAAHADVHRFAGLILPSPHICGDACCLPLSVALHRGACPRSGLSCPAALSRQRVCRPVTIGCMNPSWTDIGFRWPRMAVECVSTADAVMIGRYT
jgi:hypothetical protein